MTRRTFIPLILSLPFVAKEAIAINRDKQELDALIEFIAPALKSPIEATYLAALERYSLGWQIGESFDALL